jgi:hypothetical protein
VDITVYLPDELGQRAKDEGLPLSQMLRTAVIDRFAQADAQASLQDGMEVIELDLEDRVGRFTGTELAEDIYLHEDGRVIVYKPQEERFYEVQDPVEELRGVLDEESYLEVVGLLGLTPVVEI